MPNLLKSSENSQEGSGTNQPILKKKVQPEEETKAETTPKPSAEKPEQESGAATQQPE